MTEERQINDITVGPRHRHDLGDITALAESIADVGLLHPIVIRPDGQLIAGQRRLEACRQLGRATVPVHVLDLDRMSAGEYAENAIRKDFTPSEIDSIRRALLPVEQAAAKERQRVAGPSEGPGKKQSASGNFPEAVKGQARDKVGAFAGVSGRTMEKIAAVVEAAERDPGQFAPLVEEMDRTGKIDRAYRKVKGATSSKTNGGAPAEKGRAAKNQAAVAERRQRIRELAAEGYSIPQIASTLNLSEGGIKRIVRQHHIDVPASRTMKGSRRHDPNRILRQMAADAENLVADIGLIDFDHVDGQQISEWIASFAAARKQLGSLIRRLQGTQES